RISRDWSSDVCSSDLGNRIFEGTAGFYRFGNILKDTIVELMTNPDGSINMILSFPFYKVEDLSLLFDILPQDILFTILSKLDIKIGRASCREREGNDE